MTAPLVSGLVFTPASELAKAGGLLGHAEFDLLGTVRVNVAVRRTLAGAVTLVFPVRHDRQGKQHAIIRPVDQAARERLTCAVVEMLELGGAAISRGAAQGDSRDEDSP